MADEVAVPSSDTALANWNASAPTGDGAPSAQPSGAAATQPTGVEVQPENLSLADLEAAIGADESKVEGKPGEVAPDPLEALKDNPRVQELIQSETTLKGFLGKSEYVKEPAHIEQAIADADVLWKIVDGKLHPGAILEAARQNQTPEAFQAIVAGLADYIGKLTGKPIAAAAAGKEPVAEDPVAKELREVKDNIARREQADKDAKFMQRTTAAREIMTGKLAELVKGSFLEGSESYILSQMQSHFAGKDMELIDALEKKDFKSLESAYRAVKSAEAKRFKAYADWIIKSKKTKDGTIPKQIAGGAPPANAADEPKVELDSEKRRAQMVATLRS